MLIKMFLAVVFFFEPAISTPKEEQTLDEIVSTSEANLPLWLKKWQKILNLADWKVVAKIVPVSDLKPDTLGHLSWNSISHTALIKVLRPQDYDPGSKGILKDMEFTILYELIHLQLSVLPRDLSKKEIEEGVVNNFAKALMNLEAKKDAGLQATATTIPPIPPETTGDSGRGK